MASASLSRINTNIQALNALNALNSVNSRMSVHQLRLATGKRINSAADDAAGFTIASKLKVKSETLGVALDNIGSAKNLMTVAEGHLNNIQDILTEMKGKAQQAANDTLGADERTAILEELQKFNSQIETEIGQAKWSGTALLDGGADLSFQIGAGTNDSIDVLDFNVAKEVWSGAGTTFNSAGLDVVAASSTSSTVVSSELSNVGMGTVVLATATPFTTTTTISELDSGHYNVEASYTTNGTVTIEVFDSKGANVLIDADGTNGGASGNVLTKAVSEGNLASIDLGVGLSIDIGTINTAAAGSVVMSVDYTKGGNSVGDQDSAQNFMDKVDSAISKVTDGLSYIGSQMNRLSFQENSLSVAKSNTEAAHSRIVDADMAWEQLEATKLMILQQTATSMLSQANMAPQSVLALFGG